MAQAPHVPTPETRLLAHELAGLGLPHKFIAKRVGVSGDETLAKYYRDELDDGAATANRKVASFLFCAASGMALELDQGATYADCVRAAMFWAKTRMKWRETSTLDINVAKAIEISLSTTSPDVAYRQLVDGARVIEGEFTVVESGEADDEL